MTTNEELDRVEKILDTDALSPAVLEGLGDLSPETKNQVVARIAHLGRVALSGRVLSRLPFLLTNENKADMTASFVANLSSIYPEARAASLYGLQRLAHPNLIDYALACLRDADDQVLAAACTILLPAAKQDPRIWSMLQEIYAAHKNKPEFHMSVSLMQAHGVGQ